MGRHIEPLEADAFTDEFTHPLTTWPYRAIVFSGFDHNGTAMFYLAGAPEAKRVKAVNALKSAIKIHPCRCFYCGQSDDLTIDHILPKCRGGSDAIGNLAISCRPCNDRKRDQAIADFDLKAAARWNAARTGQKQGTLTRLSASAV